MVAIVGLLFACNRVMAVDTWVGWMGPFSHGLTWVILTVTKLLHGLVSISVNWGKIFNI